MLPQSYFQLQTRDDPRQSLRQHTRFQFCIMQPKHARARFQEPGAFWPLPYHVINGPTEYPPFPQRMLRLCHDINKLLVALTRRAAAATQRAAPALALVAGDAAQRIALESRTPSRNRPVSIPTLDLFILAH